MDEDDCLELANEVNPGMYTIVSTRILIPQSFEDFPSNHIRPMSKNFKD